MFLLIGRFLLLHIPFSLAKNGEEKQLTFTVTPSKEASEVTIKKHQLLLMELPTIKKKSTSIIRTYFQTNGVATFASQSH
jgi:hypothetical protein